MVSNIVIFLFLVILFLVYLVVAEFILKIVLHFLKENSKKKKEVKDV